MLGLSPHLHETNKPNPSHFSIVVISNGLLQSSSSQTLQLITLCLISALPRAADWNLNEPIWTGRMRLVAKEVAVTLKLEDKSGALYANCPVEAYPGIAIESVSDSSRYFVIRVQDDNAGRSAFIGIGFGDRSDSFDLNVALQDHFKWVKNQQDIEKEKENPRQELDLGFKEGETIKINMKITVSGLAWDERR